MSKKGRKWGIRQVSSDELRPFENEIKKCIEDLDWSLQMYGITLKEAGKSDSEITSELRKVFMKSWKKILG